MQGWQQVPEQQVPPAAGGVTGSAPVSDPAAAANAPKIAVGRGAGSPGWGGRGTPRAAGPPPKTGHPAGREAWTQPVPPPLRPKGCPRTGTGGGRGRRREEEEEKGWFYAFQVSMAKLNLLQMAYYQRYPLGKPLAASAMLRIEELVWGAGEGRKDPKTGRVPSSCRASRVRGGQGSVAGR